MPCCTLYDVHRPSGGVVHDAVDKICFHQKWRQKQNPRLKFLHQETKIVAGFVRAAILD
jgi:hypothetical protein